MARTLVQQCNLAAGGANRTSARAETSFIGERRSCEPKSPPSSGRGAGERLAFGRVRGQAMIEYVVVLAFGVILLIQGSATEEAPVKKLATAIRDYHKHYTYAMAISTIPDCDVKYSYAVDKVGSLDLSSLGITIDMSVDPCIDWTNPSLPIPTGLSLSSSLGIPTDPGTFVQNVVTNMIDGFIGDFTNPVGLLDDMLDFSPSDFF
jgi:hypothetical protein